MANDLQSQNTSIAKQVETLGHYLAAGQKQFARALPKHMDADRMIRVALTAATKNPALLRTTPASLALALLNASALGLEPNGRDAHLVPYGNQVQLIPDYKGLAQLAYRSGQVLNIKAKAVREKDFFEYGEGTDEFLRYKGYEGDDDPGELCYAWAMAFLAGGGKPFVVLNRNDVERRKKASKSSGRSDSPWNTFTEAMWAKSAFKELSKWIPQTPELVRALKLDEQAELGKVQRPDDVDDGGIFDGMSDPGGEVIDSGAGDEPPPEESPRQSKADRMAQRVGGKQQQQKPEPPPKMPKSLEKATADMHNARNAEEVAECYAHWNNKITDVDDGMAWSDLHKWKLGTLPQPAGQGALNLGE